MLSLLPETVTDKGNTYAKTILFRDNSKNGQGLEREIGPTSRETHARITRRGTMRSIRGVFCCTFVIQNGTLRSFWDFLKPGPSQAPIPLIDLLGYLAGSIQALFPGY